MKVDLLKKLQSKSSEIVSLYEKKRQVAMLLT